ncbi:hypothetical protein EHO58_19420 [Leptospira selangorensis]|uniref:hypothetical protein n=1 Tax=Leptospira selangorensis TaxID=2484982 RepID=UPI00108422F4|nr:hypothetical protein [Leptospira selangorensis]TGJ99805.1 hypothetical protein EHO58_19420 [Leptospira selangorensis]
MKEKSIIKNPLTIIALFSGFAEACGAVVLPFIDIANQSIYVWFLIAFPSTLLIAFFLTLNFNSKVLYAPSDFENEDNYLKTQKFDNLEQSSKQVSISEKDRVNELENLYGNLFNELNLLKESIVQNPNQQLILKSLCKFIVANFQSSIKFKLLMRNLGYEFEIFSGITGENQQITQYRFEDNEGIWLGSEIPFGISIEVLKQAFSFYPHLKYIHLSNDISGMKHQGIHSQIVIGGSSKTAIERYRLLPLTDENKKSILESKSDRELHDRIRANYQSN